MGGSADDDFGISVVLANILERMIYGNKKKTGSMEDTKFIKFQSSYEPELSIQAYVGRIQKYSMCSDSCLVMALIYIDRLIENSGLIITNLNIHRILITCIMVATKFHDDVYYNNKYFAKLGGLPLKELNTLEVGLLKLLDYSVHVSTAFYDKYVKELRNYTTNLNNPSNGVHYASTIGSSDLAVCVSNRIDHAWLSHPSNQLKPNQFSPNNSMMLPCFQPQLNPPQTICTPELYDCRTDIELSRMMTVDDESLNLMDGMLSDGSFDHQYHQNFQHQIYQQHQLPSAPVSLMTSGAATAPSLSLNHCPQQHDCYPQIPNSNGMHYYPSPPEQYQFINANQQCDDDISGFNGFPMLSMGDTVYNHTYYQLSQPISYPFVYPILLGTG